MDELDLKLLRALISEGALAQSENQVNSSLRSIAARLKADDMTVNLRYKRLQESGCLSAWHLLVNPTFFGCRLMDVTVDVLPESVKADAIRKLKLVHEVTGMIDFYGRALKVIAMYNSDESRSRIVELISRITNAEKVTQIRWAFPRCRTERLTEADVAIIRSLSHDARKSFINVSKELRLSTRTVRNRLGRLRRENTVFMLPVLNMGGVSGLIPIYLSYTYSQKGEKSKVDRAMLSQFGGSYLSLQFADPLSGYIFFGASTMAEVQDCLDWAKSQPGVATSRVDILTRTMMFPEKLTELLSLRNEKAAIQSKAFF